jgi:NAD(P)-dependent dehydrogenase (short-subunit alcohol dehydrogenase family)
MKDNFNHVVLVTGATGVVGRALVQYLLERGEHVIATAPDPARLDGLRDQFAANGTALETIAVDLREADGVEFLAVALAERKLYPTALTNNARSLDSLAVDKNGRPTRDNWVAEFTLGVIAAHDLTLRLATMSGSTLRSVVNVASMYGVVAANPALYDDPITQSPIHYGTVKSALIQLTKELAIRLAPRGIRVNAISPGGIEGRANTAFLARYARLSPAKRMLYPVEVAAAAAFLLSDEASGITGHNLLVDGGWTAW